jgi:uncharacterized membrane protein
MAEKTTDIEAYLKQLREELEVLGPRECDEVVSDVRALLGDAVAEHGGEESAALSGFGTPEELAQRMLEERAASGEWTGPPRASWWRRAGAVALDAAILVWGASLTWGLLVGLPSLRGAWGNALAVAGIVLALFSVALLGMFLILVVISRRRSGGSTTGMQMFGLKYVRVGADGRIVGVKDIPGARREWRWDTIVVTVFAVLALYSMGQYFVKWPSQNAAAEAHQAVNMAGTSVSVVSEAYRSVLDGEPDQSSANFSPGGESARRALLARRAAGKLRGYRVVNVELDEVYTTNGLPQ